MIRIIAGKFKGRLLKTPKTTATRPTQGMLREAVFNICQNTIEGARFLDLFAGSGSVGFEALSRGASLVTFIEKDPRAIACLKANIEMLGVKPQAHILSGDVAASVKRLYTPFDLIYIDPPYDTPVDPLLDALIEKKLIAEGCTLFVEERNTKELPYTPAPLIFKGSRRFGEALLRQYCVA
jgi:16S rRNA (guanine(966)-N(2))-methyltransferase RsmD